MNDKDDTILVQTLTDSFRRQLDWYMELREVVRQLMSRLVLSRGSLSQLTDGLQKKKQLVEEIEAERHRIAGPMSLWLERKNSIIAGDDVESFDKLLQMVTAAIKDFLDDEDQLRVYLEGILSRTSST